MQGHCLQCYGQIPFEIFFPIMLCGNLHEEKQLTNEAETEGAHGFDLAKKTKGKKGRRLDRTRCCLRAWREHSYWLLMFM